MLKYEYINKEWIVSPTARRVYRTAAVVSLTLFVPLVAALLGGFDAIRPFLRPLVFIGVLGTATNLVGMEYFLARFDNSHALKQVFWFCALLFIPIGPALYCFSVYSHSDAIKSACAETPDGLSGQAR
jgi:hypothetical protein